MYHDEYFQNLDEVEKSWRELRAQKFPQNLRDELWGLCMKGQTLFWKLALDNKKNVYPVVKTVPAFERAVMLLEQEERYDDVIKMCEQANRLGISTDWYNKRIQKYKKGAQ